MQKLLRKLRGWVRLNVFGVCPHCCSDAANKCPICDRDLYWMDCKDYGMWSGARKIVWNRYVRLINSN